MNHHQHEQAERLGSYLIGCCGISWGSLMAMTADATTILGFLSALVGFIIVTLRGYKDIAKFLRELRGKK